MGYPLVARVVRVAKTQNISSIADFVAARYGKSERVAALVSLIALVGSIPYIALQLKAVSSSLDVFLGAANETLPSQFPLVGDLAFVVALVLAGFAVAFGTRHTDATEHQNGLLLAISLESVVKLIAFLVVGGYITFVMFDGYDAIVQRLNAQGTSSRPDGHDLGLRQLHHADPALELRRPAPAASVPRDRGREPRHRGPEADRLAVSALSASSSTSS